MQRGIIIINGNGTVYIPEKVMMRDFEITELFGVMMPTIRSNVRTILKAGIASADCTNGATLVGNNILPDYYGLDMIIAIAFRIQSSQAEAFRRWVLNKVTDKEQNINHQIFVTVNNKESAKTVN